ncbi:MAG: hypothetical protein CMH55_02315 [Myxococcales bacterium]|nr:hypothetical protein [Myxococcales bacterium]|tara:strand:+ start:1172 stop:1711 length:540 start_codon:yes stop_codon:yes gene_type:complete
MTQALIPFFLLAAPPAQAVADAPPPAPAARILQRQLAGTQVSIEILPGVPKMDTVTEVKVQISKKGVGGPVPVTKARLSAEIRPDMKVTKDRKLRRALRKAKPTGRWVHSLPDRGTYGFHVTLPASGSYLVKVTGTIDGVDVETEFGLHADVWPAPDLQTEQSAQPTSGRSRRPLLRRR